MRLLICAGGTGGGIYPALAAAQAVQSLAPDTKFLWLGGVGGMEERLVPQAKLPLALIPAAGLHGVSWRQAPANAFRLAQGMFAARKIIGEFHPDALLVTGGYVTIPAAVVAKACGVPIILYVPDIEPALAAKTAAKVADRIAVTTEDSRKYYPQRAPVAVTGYPLRREVLEATRERGRKNLNIPADMPVLLVTGGSRGARSINQALLASLPELLEVMMVIHITGTLDYPEVKEARKKLTDVQVSRYIDYPYLDESMGDALASADLVVSRAGASILGEYPHFGLPSVLVPYPYAWRYQNTNAEYLAKYNAAEVLKDHELSTKLAGTVTGLMKDEPRRKEMRASLEKLATKNAELKLAGEILAFGKAETR